MSAPSNPALPFIVWLAAIDLLCCDAWQLDAYALGPQPWPQWHAAGWTPERTLLELSTPIVLPDLEEPLLPLDRPTVTIRYAHRSLSLMHSSTLSTQPIIETIEIALRYLDIQNPLPIPLPTREDKIRALARLNITVPEGMAPLSAWVLAMCRENGLPETLPAIPIGDVANELCPNWIWWLA